MNLHLLGVRRHLNPDSVCQRRSLARKTRPDAKTRIKQKLMSRFSMTDTGDVLLVVGMGVTRDREKGTVTITQEKYTKSLAGAVRHGKRQLNVHAWCGKRAVVGPAGGEVSNKGGNATFPGHRGRRYVPWTAASQWHLLRRQSTGKGDV